MALDQPIFAQDRELCLDGRIVRKNAFPTDAGGYADVYEGIFEGCQKVAIKVVRPFRLKRDKLLRRLWREYLAWSCLSHPNILPCLGYSYDFSPGTYTLPSLISPWMGKGTIISYIEDHPEANCLDLLIGVAAGLSYLHTRDPIIVHGDLRGGNILISDQGMPCLTDFGLSRVLEEIKGVTTSSEFAGTVRWMSPELFEFDGKVSVHSDIWAFGMTVLEIMTGERPYSHVRSDLIVLGQIREGRLPPRPEDPKILQVFRDDVWDMCQLCWSLCPTARPSMDMLMHTMTRPSHDHPPLQSGCISWSFANDFPDREVTITNVPLICPNKNSIICKLCFSVDGRYLAISCIGNIAICNTSTGKSRNLYSREKFHLTSLCIMRFSPDGEKLAIRDGKGDIMIWDTSILEMLAKYGGMRDDDDHSVRTLEFSPDGRLLFSSDARDWELRICDMVTGKQKNLHLDLPSPSEWNILACSPCGNLIAISQHDMNVYLWDTGTNALLERLLHTEVVVGARFLPGGKELFSWCFNGLVNLWDLSQFLGHPNRNTPVDMQHYKSFTAAGEQAEKLSICSASWDHCNEYPIRIAGTGDLKWVLSQSRNGDVFFWDLGTERCIMEIWFKKNLPDVTSVELGPTSGMIAAVNVNRESLTVIRYRVGSQ